MAVVVSLINMKGGVGKTTIASQLCHAADLDGLKVLAVDLDPQANLSQCILGTQKYVDLISHENPSPTVVQILEDYIPSHLNSGGPTRLKIDDLILRQVGLGNESENNLDLILSRLELSRTLKNPTGKERRLAKAISQIEDQYDLVVIDCAPTESILTDAAYFASKFIVVPVKLEFMATIGLPLLANSIASFCLENEDHQLQIAGLVLNDQSEYQDNDEKELARKEVLAIATKQDWRIYSQQVPYSRSYARAAREGLPLAATPHARETRIEGFKQLKSEIFQSIGIEEP